MFPQQTYFLALRHQERKGNSHFVDCATHLERLQYHIKRREWLSYTSQAFKESCFSLSQHNWAAGPKYWKYRSAVRIRTCLRIEGTPAQKTLLEKMSKLWMSDSVLTYFWYYRNVTLLIKKKILKQHSYRLLLVISLLLTYFSHQYTYLNICKSDAGKTKTIYLGQNTYKMLLCLSQTMF